MAPAAAVGQAARAGLSTIAVTDHDTVSGVREAMAAGVRAGVTVIAGSEISARADWGEVHLLAYFLPIEDAGVTDFLASAREARWRRARETVSRLARHGIRLHLDDVVHHAADVAIGRPHIARAMVAVGAVADVQDAFDQWLGRGRPACVPKTLASVGEVGALASRVGAVLVVAHLGEQGTGRRVRALCRQGVVGVEVRHPSHSVAVENRLLRLARECDLVVTGGSDWHGDGPSRRRRSGLGQITVPDHWVEALAQRQQTVANG